MKPSTLHPLRAQPHLPAWGTAGQWAPAIPQRRCTSKNSWDLADSMDWFRGKSQRKPWTFPWNTSKCQTATSRFWLTHRSLQFNFRTQRPFANPGTVGDAKGPLSKAAEVSNSWDQWKWYSGMMHQGTMGYWNHGPSSKYSIWNRGCLDELNWLKDLVVNYMVNGWKLWGSEHWVNQWNSFWNLATNGLWTISISFKNI